MSKQAVEGHDRGEDAERHQLLPVVGGIFLCYLTILGVGYVVGNMIYQIP